MQTPHSTAPSDGHLFAPSAAKAQPTPGRLGAEVQEGQPEGDILFEDELRRAAGDDGSADAKRTQREAADARRSAQAGKAEHNQAQREAHRNERAGAQEARADRRSDRANATEARPEPQPPARPEARVASEAPEAPEATPEPPSDRRRATAAQPEPAAHGESAARRARLQPGASPAALPQPPQAPPSSTTATQTTAPQATPRAAAPAPGPQTGQQGQPDTGAAAAERNARTASSQPARPEAAFRDLVSELMVTREADLDRQASVLRQVRAHLAPGGREISIALSPASLGQIQMRLALRSGRLTAVMRATRPETLEALQNQLPELTATLEAQGFEVQDFDLALA